jgi:protein SCO1
VVKKGDGAKSPPASQSQQLEQGSPVPDFELVNQDGKQIDLRQYSGKALLLTFIYTRCPLPDYCPLMSHNFAEIDKELAKTPALYAKTHLLSISFDPKNDTPEVLREYGHEYVQDKGQDSFDHWDFAAVLATERGDVIKFFDIFYNEQDGQITHSMSTAIISPDGKLYKWYGGNEWKPADVLADLISSLPGQSQTRLGASLTH